MMTLLEMIERTEDNIKAATKDKNKAAYRYYTELLDMLMDKLRGL